LRQRWNSGLRDGISIPSALGLEEITVIHPQDNFLFLVTYAAYLLLDCVISGLIHAWWKEMFRAHLTFNIYHSRVRGPIYAGFRKYIFFNEAVHRETLTRNFFQYLCQLVFAAIFSVKLLEILEMFVTLLSFKYAWSLG